MKMLKSVIIYLCSYSLLFASNSYSEMQSGITSSAESKNEVFSSENSETESKNTENKTPEELEQELQERTKDSQSDSKNKKVQVSIGSVDSSTEQYVSMALLLAIAVVSASFMKSCVKKTKDMWVAGLGALVLIWGEMQSTQDFGDLEYPNIELEQTKDGKLIDNGGQRAYFENLKKSYADARDTAKSKSTMQMAAGAAFTVAAIMATMQSSKNNANMAACKKSIETDINTATSLNSCFVESLRMNLTTQQTNIDQLNISLETPGASVPKDKTIEEQILRINTLFEQIDTMANPPNPQPCLPKKNIPVPITSKATCTTYITTAQASIAACVPASVEGEAMQPGGTQTTPAPEPPANGTNPLPKDPSGIPVGEARALQPQVETSGGRVIPDPSLGNMMNDNTIQGVRDNIESRKGVKLNRDYNYKKGPKNLIEVSPLRINLLWSNIYAFNFGMTAVGVGAMAGFMGKSIPFVDNLIAVPSKRAVVWGVFSLLAFTAASMSAKASDELDARIKLIDQILSKLDDKAGAEEGADSSSQTGVVATPESPSGSVTGGSDGLTPLGPTDYTGANGGGVTNGSVTCPTGMYDQNGACYTASDIMNKENITNRDFGIPTMGFTEALAETVDSMNTNNQAATLKSAGILGQMATKLQDAKRNVQFADKSTDYTKEEAATLERFKNLAAPSVKGKAAAGFFDNAARLGALETPPATETEAKEEAAESVTIDPGMGQGYSVYTDMGSSSSEDGYYTSRDIATDPYNWNDPKNKKAKENAMKGEKRMDAASIDTSGRSIFEILSNRYLQKSGILLKK